MRVLITRHGQTEENLSGILQGQGHGTITKHGYSQIEALIKRLEKENVRLIISSDASWCIRTTRRIADVIHMPVEYTPLIRKKDNGGFVGKRHDLVDWEGLGEFEARKAPGGENLIEVRERARKFFRGLKERSVNDTILVVSHGTFLKLLIGDAMGMSLHDSIFKLCIDNCSLTEIDVDPKLQDGFVFGYINDRSHALQSESHEIVE